MLSSWKGWVILCQCFPYNCTGLGSPTGPKKEIIFFECQENSHFIRKSWFVVAGAPLCGAVPKRDSACAVVCETWCECKVREIFQQGVACVLLVALVVLGLWGHRCDIVDCFVWYLCQWTSQSPTFQFDIFYLLAVFQLNFPKNVLHHWITWEGVPGSAE